MLLMAVERSVVKVEMLIFSTSLHSRILAAKGSKKVGLFRGLKGMMKIHESSNPPTPQQY